MHYCEPGCGSGIRAKNKNYLVNRAKNRKKFHEKALLVIITHFSTRERLCECIGIYRHVVVNIVLFFATCMYTVVDMMYSVCKHKGPIQWDTEDQYKETKCMYRKGLIVWAYADTMHACTKEQSYRDTRYLCVQRTNPMGIGCCHAQIEDQSYEHMMHVQSSNPMGRCM